MNADKIKETEIRRIRVYPCPKDWLLAEAALWMVPLYEKKHDSVKIALRKDAFTGSK